MTIFRILHSISNTYLTLCKICRVRIGYLNDTLKWTLIYMVMKEFEAPYSKLIPNPGFNSLLDLYILAFGCDIRRVWAQYHTLNT